MNQKRTKWGFSNHLICSFLITILTLLSDFISTGGGMLYSMAFSNVFIRSEASAIGIIGGADGPTAIFLSGNPFSLLIISKIILFVLLIMLFIPTKKIIDKRFDQ